MGMITVGIGDAQVSNNPEDVLVTHALGSCIALALHDPLAGVAGLLHILLPDSKSAPHKAAMHPCMFADTGIPALFHAAYALGAQKSRVTVRVLGGAQILDGQGVFNIGKQNYLACRRILWAAGVLIAAEQVGGTVSRNVRLAVGNGCLEWNTAGGPQQQLPVASRPAPAAARQPAPSPAVCAQLEVCRECLASAAVSNQEAPLGARAHAPRCADCVLSKSALSKSVMSKGGR